MTTNDITCNIRSPINYILNLRIQTYNLAQFQMIPPDLPSEIPRWCTIFQDGCRWHDFLHKKSCKHPKFDDASIKFGTFVFPQIICFAVKFANQNPNMVAIFYWYDFCDKNSCRHSTFYDASIKFDTIFYLGWLISFSLICQVEFREL